MIVCVNSLASKGKAVHLLKGSSKKKRSRAEMEEVKQEEELLNSDKQKFLRQFKMLKAGQGLGRQNDEQIRKN